MERNSSFFFFRLFLLFAGVVGGVSALGVTVNPVPVRTPPPTKMEPAPPTSALTSLYERFHGTVVEIVSRAPTGEYRTNGTATVVSADGYLLTARHLIGNGTNRYARLSDDRVVALDLVGESVGSDLTLARIDAGVALRFVEPRLLAVAAVGERVFTIGNPYGYVKTLSQGVISGLGRRIVMPTGEALSEIVQVDVALNQGNSGGPLLTMEGRWVGMIVAIRTEADGMGFAVSGGTIGAFLARHLRVRP